MLHKNRRKFESGRGGFTLIELLVVIAIIAILSTVVMAGLNSARLKGRDANRIASVKQVQSALELYNDSCGGYPDLGPSIIGGTLGTPLLTTTAVPSCPTGTNFGTFMASLPSNPSPGGDDYYYCGAPSGLPTSNVNPLTTGGTSCGGTPGSVSYGIGFTLEGQSGTLVIGDHVATPSGIL